MDALDRELIARLRANARTPVADLAHALKVSRSTVSNRMAKLEREGVVTGYTVLLKPDSHTHRIVAWMSIQIEGNDSRRVMLSLLGEPGVTALHGTNGRWDALAELQADSLAELSNVLERVRLIKGIQNTETSIHLSNFRG